MPYLRSQMHSRTSPVLRIGILCCVAFVSQAYAAHQLPIGIPSPTAAWGGTQEPLTDTPPARPTNWNQEMPGFYFIDQAAGSNDGRVYGAPGAPRRTLPDPIPAGSYVELHGDYALVKGGSQFVNANGTSAGWSAGSTGPVWLTSTDANPGRFVNEKVIFYGSYLYVERIGFSAGGRVQIGSAATNFKADHIVIRNVVVEGIPTKAQGHSLFSIAANTQDRTENIILINSIGFNAGDINSETDDDDGIIVVGANTSNVWILDNVGSEASGSGIQIIGAGIHNVYVGRNEMFNVRQSGIWLKDGKDVVFSENHIHDIIDTSWSPSKCMGTQYRPNGLWMIYNRLHDCRYGIRVPSTDGGQVWSTYLIGNVIYDIALGEVPALRTAWETAAIHFQGSTNRFIINNIIHNVAHGITFSGNGGQLNILNNVISGVTSVNGRLLWVENGGLVTKIDNNYFSQSTGSPMIKWGSADYSVAQFASNAGQCANCRTGTIQIGDDLVPVSFTELQNAGVESEVYALYQATFGVPLDVDYFGAARIQGGVIDIGPYEGRIGSDQLRPLAPNALN